MSSRWAACSVYCRLRRGDSNLMEELSHNTTKYRDFAVRLCRKHTTSNLRWNTSPKNAVANVVTAMVTLPILSFSQIPRHVPRPVVGAIVPHRREKVVVISRIHMAGDSDLFEIAETTRSLGFFLGLGKCRQQHSRKDGDNGNHHQKLN